MVEWIEIFDIFASCFCTIVSTLVVEWIEIESISYASPSEIGLHPRGGVD